MARKPEPVSKYVVCSVCGLDWEKHGDSPDLLKCVELLRKALQTAMATPNPSPQFFWGSAKTSPLLLEPGVRKAD